MIYKLRGTDHRSVPSIIAALTVLFLAIFVCLAADQPSDNLITDQVRIRLAGDADVKGGALEVTVAQGVVTIKGAVETQHAKDKATKLAKKVKGVKQVVNNITVDKKTGGR